MDSSTYVVIVGAGPYGLSLAAHLRDFGVPFRIFGRPMETWATRMPNGMRLKSDGFASNLYAAASSYTLKDFCRETGRLYHSTHHPVPVEDFVAYGQEFARRFVPTLEACNVAMVEPLGGDDPARSGQNRFRVRLENGESLLATQVVLAVGLTPFPHLPEMLRQLPPSMVSHTADHRLFHEFCSRDVTVLGRGASALNAAALLNECGARTTLISRHRTLHIHRSPSIHGRSLLQQLRHPASPLGPSLRSWFASRMPVLLHALPGFVRRGLFYKHLGPSGGSSLRGRVQGRLPMLLGWSITDAELLDASDPTERRIKLTLVNEQDQVREHVTSHVIAGTGFRVDVQRLRFVAPTLLASLRLEKTGSPALDRNFGASVNGLYFVGPVASSSFGPLLRFAAGAEFASGRLGAHLARSFAKHARRAAAREFGQAGTQERHAA